MYLYASLTPASSPGLGSVSSITRKIKMIDVYALKALNIASHYIIITRVFCLDIGKGITGHTWVNTNIWPTANASILTSLISPIRTASIHSNLVMELTFWVQRIFSPRIYKKKKAGSGQWGKNIEKG